MKDLPKIYGFNKTSEAGKEVFAYSVFLSGCNFRCPYCMNARLVKGEIEKSISIDEIKNSVKENDIEWVMVSGGEPTCTDLTLLVNLLEEIKSWGCKIGLSTNGSKPDILEKILGHLNFVAMDVKSADYLDYQEIDAEGAMETKNLIHQSKILLEKCKLEHKDEMDYEIRTTLYPPYFDNIYDDMYRISSFMSINKNDRWVLQQFRHSKNMLNPDASKIKPFSDRFLREIMEEARKYCDDVSIRYV